jgi:transposase-like protein
MDDEPEKGAVGRPTAYRPEMVEQGRKLAHLGATDREIAEFFDVSESTLYLWKHQHPEFSEAIKLGKDAPDARVVQSLYRKAVGYSYDSEKVFQYEGEVIRAPVVEHVPPSDTAAIFWLKNRRRDEWRDRQDVELEVVDRATAIAEARARLIEGKD